MLGVWFKSFLVERFARCWTPSGHIAVHGSETAGRSVGLLVSRVIAALLMTALLVSAAESVERHRSCRSVLHLYRIPAIDNWFRRSASWS